MVFVPKFHCSLGTRSSSNVIRQHKKNAYPNTVNVSDSERDLPTKFLLVEFHLDYFEGEPFVEQPVDFGTARQFVRVDLSRARALDRTLKVCL